MTNCSELTVLLNDGAIPYKIISCCYSVPDKRFSLSVQVGTLLS